MSDDMESKAEIDAQLFGQCGIPADALRSALACVSGEPVVLIGDVDWDLKNPCDDCPFLKTSKFHDGVANELPNYFDAILAGRFAHTCHKTDDRPSCDGPHTFHGTPKHCAGAILMLLKTGRGLDMQRPLLEAVRTRKLLLTDLCDMKERALADERVFRLPELVNFYAAGLGERRRNDARDERRRAQARRRKRKKQQRKRKRR